MMKLAPLPLPFPTCSMLAPNPIPIECSPPLLIAVTTDPSSKVTLATVPVGLRSVTIPSAADALNEKRTVMMATRAKS